MAAPTPRKVDISEIKSRLLKPALTSHYICEFLPPLEKMQTFLSGRESAGWIGANYANTENQKTIQIACSEASLPGSSLMTNEINDDFTGVTERHAYRRQYDDRIDFSFYVDTDYKIINFFESWIAYVVGEDSYADLERSNYFYRVNYPSNYKTDNLYITKFERDYQDSGQLVYQFIGAYPISIASMPIAYDSSQLLKCTVSFTYTRYRVSNIRAATPQSSTPTNSALEGTPTSTVVLYSPNGASRTVTINSNEPTLPQLSQPIPEYQRPPQ